LPISDNDNDVDFLILLAAILRADEILAERLCDIISSYVIPLS
jgi:hypothetical protein